MERRSLLDYFDDFASHGTECAYVYPRGYRHERWSYRQIADTARRFAREDRTIVLIVHAQPGSQQESSATAGAGPALEAA